MRNKFAVEMFSVRDDMAKDLWGTLRKVKAMGYEGIEMFGGYTHTAQELKAALDETGLVCCGWHKGMDAVSPENLITTITYNKVIGNTDIVIPWIPEEMHNSKEACIKTAAEFDAIAAWMADYGMYLGYHNHNFEFTQMDDDVPFNYFFDYSKRLTMQLDNGNAWSAGPEVDVYEPMIRHAYRARTVHLKPWSLKTGYNTMIGEDDIDWPRFFTACKQYQRINWYIVEFECAEKYTPLEGVDACLKALKGMEKEGKI